MERTGNKAIDNLLCFLEAKKGYNERIEDALRTLTREIACCAKHNAETTVALRKLIEANEALARSFQAQE